MIRILFVCLTDIHPTAQNIKEIIKLKNIIKNKQK